jgi:hypothetical protein
MKDASSLSFFRGRMSHAKQRYANVRTYRYERDNRHGHLMPLPRRSRLGVRFVRTVHRCKYCLTEVALDNIPCGPCGSRIELGWTPPRFWGRAWTLPADDRSQAFE